MERHHYSPEEMADIVLCATLPDTISRLSLNLDQMPLAARGGVPRAQLEADA